jgi:hypothetical protein
MLEVGRDAGRETAFAAEVVIGLVHSLVVSSLRAFVPLF